MLFRNFYRCAECGCEWTDRWSAQCDDDCPWCDARHMSPYKSEDTEEKHSPVADVNKSAPFKTRDRIRVLNDNFRSTFIGGVVVMTAGVTELPIDIKAHVVIEVQTFEEFDPDNDPWGEHDFGGFELVGQMFFWKIDYYDTRCELGSEDPADPAKTTRVLTIMLAEEH